MGCALAFVAILVAGVSIWRGRHAAGAHARAAMTEPQLADEKELRYLAPDRAPTVAEACVLYPIEYALGSNERNDVVFFGESACRAGVDPAQFERLTGLRAYNLGGAGALGPLGQVTTARAYFSHHSPPRIAVLCVIPISFEYPTDEDMTRRFVETYGSKSDAGRLSVRLPLERVFEVRNVPLRGWEFATFWSLQRQIVAGRGFLSLIADHGLPHPLLRAGQTVIVRDDWDKGVRAIAELCEESRVRLLVRFLPLSSAVLKTENFGPLETWAASLKDCHNVIVARPVLLWYKPELMWDHIHPNATGAEQFTARVAEDVQHVLDSQ